MSDDAASAVSAPGQVSAGRLLREARERQGLHIAALAASIKVAQKKLEMLESDRFDQLPDATFTRALAQTVCRALKIDSAPIMGLLPPAGGHRLEQVGEGLNARFRQRPGALVEREWGGFAKRPAFWITALILVAAVAVFFLPRSLFGRASASATSAPATTVIVVPAAEVAARARETPGMPPPEAQTVNEAPYSAVEPASTPSPAASATIAGAPAPR